MNRVSTDVCLIVIGAAATLPWVAYSVHVQNDFYGWARRSYFSWATGWSWGFVLGFVLLTAGVMLAGGGFGLIFWSIVDLGKRLGITLPIDNWDLGGAGFVCVFVSYGLIGRWKQRRFLRLMELESPRCRKCEYALRGLRPRRGQIRCPECGHVESVKSVVKRFERHKRRAEIDRKFPV
jgi:hypothetical protein